MDIANAAKIRSTDLAFTPAVQAEQAARGSAKAYANHEMQSQITVDLAAFIATRTSFYLATASADGQPYIQHRGGPAGFLQVLGLHTLAFADYRGNRQYITLGNLSENPKAFLFLMDYANRQRVKIWGRARFVEDDEALMERLVDPAYRARPQRAIVFEVEAWDPNCPQHIPVLHDEETVRQATEQLTQRIAALEAELAALKRTS